MNHKSEVERYVHSVLKKYQVKNAKKAERAINYRAVSRKLKELREDEDATEELVQNRIMYALAEDAKSGGGEFYNSYLPRRTLRGLKQIGRKEIKPGSALFYLRHPILAVRDSARKLVGYEQEDKERKAEAISEVAQIFSSNPNVPTGARKTANEVSKLSSYKQAVDVLREGGFIGGYRAKDLAHRIEKQTNRGVKNLTDLMRTEIAAVFLFAFGAFLIGFSFGNPVSLSGYSVLEGPTPLHNFLMIGIGVMVVSYTAWLYVRSK